MFKRKPKFQDVKSWMLFIVIPFTALLLLQTLISDEFKANEKAKKPSIDSTTTCKIVK